MRPEYLGTSIYCLYLEPNILMHFTSSSRVLSVVEDLAIFMPQPLGLKAFRATPKVGLQIHIYLRKLSAVKVTSYTE